MTKNMVMQNNLNIYTHGLISTQGTHTCTAMAASTNQNHDKLYRIVSNEENGDLARKNLIEAAIKLCLAGKVKLIIDDTSISKIHAKNMEGLSDVYNGSLGRVEQGFSLVVGILTDDHIVIPFDFSLWVQECIAKNSYVSKQQQAIGLMKELIKLNIKFDIAILDGLYCTQQVIDWCNSNDVAFEMRIHSNRVVTTSDGCTKSLKKHTAFRFAKNGRRTTRYVTWHGHKIYITSYRLRLPFGQWKILFLASNRECSPKEHMDTYEQRWSIEKMFRTMKQKLGLSDCMSRSFNRQRTHILLVFYAYYQLQLIQKQYKLSSADVATKRFIDANVAYHITLISPLGEIFHAVA